MDPRISKAKSLLGQAYRTRASEADKSKARAQLAKAVLRRDIEAALKRGAAEADIRELLEEVTS